MPSTSVTIQSEGVLISIGKFMTFMIDRVSQKNVLISIGNIYDLWGVPEKTPL